MSRVMKRLSAIVLAVVLTFGLMLTGAYVQPGAGDSPFCVTAYAATISKRGTDVTQAAAGNTFVPIRGFFYAVSKKDALDCINEIRYEACKEGVINPATGEKLTLADYTPIKWSSDLERIAQTRAAEASVSISHSRPNGTSCFDCVYNGHTSWGETLAWNDSGWLMGVAQWYDEKSDWVKQTSGAMTGHYTALINPENRYVALGCFRLLNSYTCAVSGEFSFEEGLAEDAVGVSGLYDQTIEVPSSEISSYKKYSNTKINLYEASVANIKNQTYKGSAIKPSTTIKHEGIKLVNGTDYSLTYKNNKNIGTATVIIKGKGLYSGTVKKTFKIVPKTTSISKLIRSKKAITVKWKKQAKQTTGYQIQYSTNKNFKSGNKTITVKGTKVTSKKITKLKAKKKYYVRVRTYKTVNGKKYCSAWSKAKSTTTK